MQHESTKSLATTTKISSQSCTKIPDTRIEEVVIPNSNAIKRRRRKVERHLVLNGIDNVSPPSSDRGRWLRRKWKKVKRWFKQQQINRVQRRQEILREWEDVGGFQSIHDDWL